MFQFRTSSIPCPPTHEGQENSGHTYLVRGWSNFPKTPTEQTGFEVQCTRCGFETTSKKPLRKDIDALDHEHDWHSTRAPMDTPYAFCFHCKATKETKERFDAVAYGKECDHCGPSEFRFYGTYPTDPIQRVYKCVKCNDVAVRFHWHPMDFPNLTDDISFLVIPSVAIVKIFENPEEKGRILGFVERDWNYEGKLCDGCGVVTADAKVFRNSAVVVSIHEDHPKGMRYIKEAITHRGETTDIYMDYCFGCREKNNLLGHRVLVASTETYDANDRIASALTSLKIRRV